MTLSKRITGHPKYTSRASKHLEMLADEQGGRACLRLLDHEKVNKKNLGDMALNARVYKVGPMLKILGHRKVNEGIFPKAMDLADRGGVDNMVRLLDNDKTTPKNLNRLMTIAMSDGLELTSDIWQHPNATENNLRIATLVASRRGRGPALAALEHRDIADMNQDDFASTIMSLADQADGMKDEIEPKQVHAYQGELIKELGSLPSRNTILRLHAKRSRTKRRK